MRFFLAILILFQCAGSEAQTPQYKCTNYTGSTVFTGVGFSQPNPIKNQSIYYPSNFPGMPEGYVTALYFRMGRWIVSSSTVGVYDSFRIRIGYSPDSFFSPTPGYDSFITGLTTVFEVPKFTITGLDSIGKWVRIPVPAGAFRFDRSRMFVFEIAHGTMPRDTGSGIMATNPAVSSAKPRTLGGHKDSARVYGGRIHQFMDLGIDMQASGAVGAPGITELQVYPNPGTGQMQVSFQAAHAAGPVSLRLYNGAGQQVMQRSYRPAAGSFKASLDVRSLPRGQYYLALECGSTAQVRPLTLQ